MESNLRILHLDIDADVSEAVRKTLTAGAGGFGLKIDRVERPAEFRKAVESHDYDLILSAWSLPEADGMEALRFARQSPPCPPFIFLVDVIAPEQAVDAVKAGADNVVLKTGLDRLRPAVTQAFDARRPQPAPPRPDHIVESDRRKDELLAMLVHALRNPLAPMRSALEVLRLIGAHDPALKHHTDIIDRQVSYQARLIGDLFDISRILEGKMEMRKSPIDLNDVLAQAVELSLPPVELRRHKLNMLVEGRPLRVEADPDRLVQAISALLANSVKFTEQDGQIWLEAKAEDGTIIVKVRDTGMGIAPEMLPQIFDLPIELGRDRSRGGLGVGLTLVKQIIDLHGGSIEARSEGIGCGSEFVIRLPAFIDEKTGNAPHAQGFTPAWSPMRRILVVDDVADSAESLADLLILWGHDIQTAHDGPTAIKVAHAFQPEVVLLDIGMPGMDGYQVARTLREMKECADALLVAMTGYGQEEDRELALQAGFDRHLTKPVELEELQKILTSF
ncbi:response regulator [bacterium]|nr:response regulator [bacterium]